MLRPHFTPSSRSTFLEGLKLQIIPCKILHRKNKISPYLGEIYNTSYSYPYRKSLRRPLVAGGKTVFDFESRKDNLSRLDMDRHKVLGSHLDPNMSQGGPNMFHLDPNMSYFDPNMSHLHPIMSHFDQNVSHFGPNMSHLCPDTSHLDIYICLILV